MFFSKDDLDSAQLRPMCNVSQQTDGAVLSPRKPSRRCIPSNEDEGPGAILAEGGATDDTLSQARTDTLFLFSKKKTLKDVALYWPNLLGYLRFLLVVVGLFVDLTQGQFRVNALLYVLSFYLDMWDGTLARYLNQTSTFGVGVGGSRG